MSPAIRRTGLVVVIGVLALGAVRPLHGQGARQAPAVPAASPEILAERYFAALRSSDWPAIASLMHPRALATMRGFVDAVASADRSGALLSQLLGAGSTEQLAALSDEEVFARFLRATLGANGEMADVLRSSRGAVLGHITEGADTAHVLYRLRLGVDGVEMTKVEVLSAARDGTGWRALLTADIENLIQRIRAAGA